MADSVDFSISASELEREILRQVRDQAELTAEGREKAGDVKDFAQSISPIDSGEYAGAWHVESRVRKTAAGMPAFRITNDSPIAEIVEDGTGPAAKRNPRKQGGSSPAHKVRAKTAAHFNGTEELVE